MIADNVYGKDDSEADKKSKGDAVLKACGDGWKLTAEKQKEINDAYDACVPVIACFKKSLNDSCGEKKICAVGDPLLKCVGEKDAACDEINVCKADLVCDANTKKCTEASAE